MKSEQEMLQMLKKERSLRPLNPNLLKRDYAEPYQVCLFYYNLNPLEPDHHPQDMQVLKSIDYLGLYKALMHSKFILFQQNGVDLHAFSSWLQEKGFEIPLHFHTAGLVKTSTSEDSENDGESPVQELKSTKLPLLLGEIAGRLMQEVSNDPEYHLMPALEVVRKSDEFKSFKSIVKKLRGKDFEDDWYARKTSSRGPRSRK